MAYPILKLLHLFGILLAFIGAGGVIAASAGFVEGEAPWRKAAVVTHGIGVLLLAVAGFSVLSAGKIPLGGWVLVKGLIWLLVGALPYMVPRKRNSGAGAWFATLALGLSAIFLVIFRPF